MGGTTLYKPWSPWHTMPRCSSNLVPQPKRSDRRESLDYPPYFNGRSPGSNWWRHWTIFLAIWIVGIFPEIKAWKIGLIYGRYFQSRILKWPLNIPQCSSMFPIKCGAKDLQIEFFNSDFANYRFRFIPMTDPCMLYMVTFTINIPPLC